MGALCLALSLWCSYFLNVLSSLATIPLRKRESWLLHLNCKSVVIWVHSVFLPGGALGWFVICDCDITWPRGHEFFHAQLKQNTKFIMLINVKMPTILAF